MYSFPFLYIFPLLLSLPLPLKFGVFFFNGLFLFGLGFQRMQVIEEIEVEEIKIENAADMELFSNTVVTEGLSEIINVTFGPKGAVIKAEELRPR